MPRPTLYADGPAARVAITLPPKLLAQVREMADADRRTTSQMIGVLLERALQWEREPEEVSA